MADELTVQPGSAYDVLSLLKQQQQGKYADEKALSQVTKIGDYLPYIQAMGSNNKDVKNGDFPMGSFSLTKNKVLVNLGKSFVALMLDWRPKAMQYQPTVLSYYNPESPLFKKIEIESQQPKSGKGFGVELLFWLPDFDEIATMFLGNPTGRYEAPNFTAAFKEGKIACKVACELIEYKKQKSSYHGARYYPYDVPVSKLPPQDRLTDVLLKFKNPPETEQVPAEAAEQGGDDRG